MAILSGSVSPSSSTMTGAPMLMGKMGYEKIENEKGKPRGMKERGKEERRRGREAR